MLIGALASLACSDRTAPDDSPGAGRFTLQVRGPAAIDAEGIAFSTPAFNTGAVEKVQLISITPGVAYTLTILFAPPMVTRSGSLSLAPGSSTQATFAIFDRGRLEYTEQTTAHAGTLTLERCSLILCVGALTGHFLFSDSLPATITASFDAR